MRLPHPPPGATRFFAKPISAWVECPRCGKLLYFGSGWGSKHSNAEWDPRTGRLKCPSSGGQGCGKVFLVGIILWPVAAGARQTTPRDQVPNERQLAQMRSWGGEGAGWWMAEEQAKAAFRPDDTNVTAGCTCREIGGGRLSFTPGCPLHS